MPRITNKKIVSVGVMGCAFFVAVIIGAVIASIAPSNFNPAGTTINIPAGATLSDTAGILKADGIIRSAFAYEVYATMLGGREKIKAGQYLFNQPESVFEDRVQDGERRLWIAANQGHDLRRL